MTKLNKSDQKWPKLLHTYSSAKCHGEYATHTYSEWIVSKYSWVITLTRWRYAADLITRPQPRGETDPISRECTVYKWAISCFALACFYNNCGNFRIYHTTMLGFLRPKDLFEIILLFKEIEEWLMDSSSDLLFKSKRTSGLQVQVRTHYS